MLKRLSFILLSLWFLLSATGYAFENMTDQINPRAIKLLWDRKPLNIVLPVGEQRLISFPEKVAFGLPSNIDNLLEIQNDNKTLYITAKAQFSPQQFVIKTQSNRAILVNLSAREKASDQMIDVIYPKVASFDDHASMRNAPISLKALLRYSIQYFYAPKRLIHPVSGIEKTLDFSGKTYALFPSGIVIATPLASFSGGGLTVTAIYLKNAINLPINLEPREVCGSWKAASFFPQSKLLASGNHYDSTLLFLVSSNDFISQYNGTCGL